MVCASPAPAPRRRWHREFLAMLPQIVTHAKVALRHLKPEARAEAVQEVVCNALQAFARLVQLKKTDIAYPTALARFGVRQTLDGRKVGGHLNVKDVSSAYCQRLKGIVLDRLDKFDSATDEWEEIVVEDRHAGPADIARVRLDFASFLASLPIRLRRIAKFLAKGETTTAASKKFGVSPGRISQIRVELKNAYTRHVGDDPGPAAAVAA